MSAENVLSTLLTTLQNHQDVIMYVLIAIAVLIVIRIILNVAKGPKIKTSPKKIVLESKEEEPKIKPSAYKKDPSNYLYNIKKAPKQESVLSKPNAPAALPELWFNRTKPNLLPEVEPDLVMATFNQKLTRFFTANVEDWVENVNLYKKEKAEAYYPHIGGVSALTATSHSRGNFVISGGRNGRIMLASRALLEPEHILEAHEGCVTALTVDPNASKEKEFEFVSAGDDLHLRFWDTSAKMLRQILLPIDDYTNGVKNTISAICFTPDSKNILIVSSNGASWLWRLNRSGLDALTTLPRRPLGIKKLCYRNQMVIAHNDKKVFYWNGKEETKVLPLKYEYDTIIGIGSSAQGLWCIDRNGTVGLE